MPQILTTHSLWSSSYFFSVIGCQLQLCHPITERLVSEVVWVFILCLYKIYCWNFKSSTGNKSVSCFIAYDWLCSETVENFQRSPNLCEVMHFSETATPKSGLDLIKLRAIWILQVYTFIFNKLNIIALILTKPCKIRIFIYQIPQSVICLS